VVSFKNLILKKYEARKVKAFWHGTKASWLYHGPPRVKWKWNAYYISTWTKVTQVSDVAHGPLVLLNVSMDIEDVHVPRILIFINIWENYRLLNWCHFWEIRVHVHVHILYIGYIILPQFLDEEPLILLNACIYVENLHVPRILIFINMW
jgi:hypothetical protein